MNGWKRDAGWRLSCVAWLNLLASKSKAREGVRMAALAGSCATSAAGTRGGCARLRAPFAAAQRRLDRARAGFDHDCRDEVTHRVLVGQRLLDLLLDARAGGRQGRLAFGSAVAMAPIVFEHPLAQRGVGGFLVTAADGRV